MLGAAVALVTFAVFSPALQNGFVSWDDSENFIHNPHYRGLAWSNIKWMVTSAHMGHYIPVAWLTLGVDYILWGMDPWGYHLTSITLHAGNAFLFYVVARRLIEVALGNATLGALSLGAATAALVFALHPLRVESVAWVTERRDLVMGFFTLLTVGAYLRAWRLGAPGRLHGGWRWMAVGFFALALLGKSIAVGLPLVLLALDVYPLRRVSPREPGWRRQLGWLAIEKAPFLALSGIVSGVMLVIGAQRGFMTPLDALGIPERLAVSAYGLTFYLGKTLAPWALSPLYFLYRPVEPLAPQYVVAGVVVLLVTATAILAFRRWPAGLAIWVGYVALLLPVIGIAHNGHQVAADRYTYVACLGWALVAGAGVAWCWEAGRTGRISRRVAAAASGAAVAVVIALGGLTIQQIAVWRDSVTLWRHAARVDPESDLLIASLGWALADQGRLEEARDLYARSLVRVPERLPRLGAQFRVHLGMIEQRSGNRGEAERWLRDALALEPGHPVALINLGVLMARTEPGKAERLFEEAARRGPEWHRYRVWDLRTSIEQVPMERTESRAHLAFAFAMLLQEYSALEEASEHYRLAATLLPRHAGAWNNLGVTYALRGRHGEAFEAFVQALRVAPAHPDACRNGRRAAEALKLRPAELRGCGPGAA